MIVARRRRRRRAAWVGVGVAILAVASLVFVRLGRGNTETVQAHFLSCDTTAWFTGTFESRERWWIAVGTPADRYRGRDVSGTAVFVSDDKATFSEQGGPVVDFVASAKPAFVACPLDP